WLMPSASSKMVRSLPVICRSRGVIRSGLIPRIADRCRRGDGQPKTRPPSSAAPVIRPRAARSTSMTPSAAVSPAREACDDFSFQPSLDKNRIMALAELQFIDRSEVIHLIGPPGTGKSHLSLALGVEAVKAGRSVYFATLADIVGALAKAEREGGLREKIRFFCRFAILIVDEIGYLPVTAGGGNLFFQLVNSRYEKGAMILTSNRGFAEW